MGFSYRKSFKAGPIRVTASKSGISYSTKVGGVRVTKRADGRVTGTTNLPGGVRYTASTKKTPKRPANGPAPKLLSAGELDRAYRTTYAQAVRELRKGEATGAELRGRLHNQGMAHPRLLKAVTEAERYVAAEAKRTAARLRGGEEELVELAAQKLRNGEQRYLVTRWLKQEQGLGFFARARVIDEAVKFNKRNR